MSAADRPRYLWFKAGLFALLAGNAVAYTMSGTLAEALDSVAWLVLLLLFELETDFGWGAGGGWTANTIRSARLLAAAAVAAAAAGYVREREWLDAINAGLWIAIVIVLELRVRSSALAGRLRAPFTAAAGILYAGLGAVAAAWMWQDEWFDAYDALLWLAALVVIEMNILRGVARPAPQAGVRSSWNAGLVSGVCVGGESRCHQLTRDFAAGHRRKPR